MISQFRLAPPSSKFAIHASCGKRRLGLFTLTACIFYLAIGVTRPLAEKVTELDFKLPLTTGGTASSEETATAAEDGGQPGTYNLDAGDKLKVTIYGRQDLTGDYVIDDEGMLRIPTLGSFSSIGQTGSEIEKRIVSVLEETQQRKSDVTVQIVERRPIYVTGLVARPGVYPFAFGMTVLHAVAVAGGSADTAATSWLPAEAVREAGKIKSAQDELKFLLAAKARLQAERDGKAQVEMPAELVALAGQAAGEDLIRQAQGVLDHQVAALERDKKSYHTAMEESQNELDSFNKELEKLNEQRSLREVWVNQIQTLSKQGLTNTQRVFDSQILLANTDRDAQAAIAAVARGQRTLERAQRDFEMLSLDRNLKIQQELQSVDQQISVLKASISGSQALIEKISKMPSALISLDRTPSYDFEVMRKGPDGKVHFYAVTETSFLRPGDVLRVKVNKLAFPG